MASTRTVNSQHGQSVILSLQKDVGSSFSVWACGMLTKELLQNHDNGKLAIVCVAYWEDNEQDWSNLQFVSAATVLICKYICDLFMQNM